MLDHVIPDLATKQDITDLRSELQGLRAVVEQRFAETHQRIWQVALAVVLGTATLVGLALRFFAVVDARFTAVFAELDTIKGEVRTTPRILAEMLAERGRGG